MDAEGKTCLHTAFCFFRKDKRAFEQICSLLLYHGCNPNLRDFEGFTGLLTAARNNDKYAVKFAIKFNKAFEENFERRVNEIRRSNFHSGQNYNSCLESRQSFEELPDDERTQEFDGKRLKLSPRTGGREKEYFEQLRQKFEKIKPVLFDFSLSDR